MAARLPPAQGSRAGRARISATSSALAARSRVQEKL